MPLTSAQTRTLDAMKAENGGSISHHYKGYIMTRDARLIPATDPEYRARAADPDSLNIETGDDPADVVTMAKDGEGRDVEASREKQKNDSALDVVAVVDPHAPKDG